MDVHMKANKARYQAKDWSQYNFLPGTIASLRGPTGLLSLSQSFLKELGQVTWNLWETGMNNWAKVKFST